MKTSYTSNCNTFTSDSVAEVLWYEALDSDDTRHNMPYLSGYDKQRLAVSLAKMFGLPSLEADVDTKVEAEAIEVEAAPIAPKIEKTWDTEF